MKKTKIICTIGPASESEEILKELLQAGMNVARINCSHGTHEEHKVKIDRFKKVREELSMAAALLLDTKGPEIRLGTFKNKKELLVEGQEFILTTEDYIGDSSKAHIKYDKLPKEVYEGVTILIDDGKIAMKVEKVIEKDIYCRVLNGGKVSDNKGINIPDVSLSMEYISPIDREDILFGVKEGIDYVAASFVRSADDIKRLRSLLDEHGGSDVKIIAKIESTEGITNFEEILKSSDGIMIARGDMGVEIPFERLPGIQKNIIRRCLQSGKLAITATQMLESMIDNPTPTRAEITDVANAVFDGTGAVMLSGETAAGSYPVEAVKAMTKILLQAESDAPKFLGNGPVWHEMDSDDVTNAVGHSACTLAKDIKATAIMAITKTGYTARRMSKFRPVTPLIGLSPYDRTINQLALEWGVIPIKVEHKEDLEVLIDSCMDAAKDMSLMIEGDKVVISAGMPLNIPGNTNIIRVETVK